MPFECDCTDCGEDTCAQDDECDRHSGNRCYICRETDVDEYDDA